MKVNINGAVVHHNWKKKQEIDEHAQIVAQKAWKIAGERLDDYIRDALAIVICVLIDEEGYSPNRALRFMARCWNKIHVWMKRYEIEDGASDVAYEALKNYGIDFKKQTQIFEENPEVAERWANARLSGRKQPERNDGQI